jgi:Alginate export
MNLRRFPLSFAVVWLLMNGLAGHLEGQIVRAVSIGTTRPTGTPQEPAGALAQEPTGEEPVIAGATAADASAAKDQPAADGKKGEEKKPSRIDPFWKDVPVTAKPFKLGQTGALPKGPGYYSLRDQLNGCCREDAPPFPYSPIGLMPGSYFDSNWKFLDDPSKSWGLTDGLKRQPLGCNWLVTSGGSFWWRYMSESNSRLGGTDQDYHLFRTRAFVDASYLDFGRIYFEAIDAQYEGASLPPLRIDQSRSDILNAFFDWRLLDVNGQPWYVRGGRQELGFGSQRLVSPLDWANTRRTFDGVRMFSRKKETDIDLFWTQPVIPDPSSLDQVDGNQHFAGAWYSKRPNETDVRDLYLLYLGNSAPAAQLDAPVPGFDLWTMGARQAGNLGAFRYDHEAMLQLGDQGTADILAGAVTLGHGHHWASLPGGPTLWLYYDWASGDRTPGSGKRNTFHQLFPFGHYYLGSADVVGRQNVHDVSLHWVAWPRPWLNFNTQFHNFSLATSTDALYNAGGTATRQDLSGAAGRSIGQELDFFWNVHVGPHSDFLAGYSRLFAGRFLRETGPADSPDLFYLQYGFRW